MDYERLLKNIIDVIKEEQLKLGYRAETIRLYYPLSSLCHLLGCECDENKTASLLDGFCLKVREFLGEITVSHSAERFCFVIPESGTAYVHEHTSDSEFIKDLIETVRKHGCTTDEIIAVFRKHSDRIHVEKPKNGEFDLLIYFEDGIPDEYYYCFDLDGLHTVYHRFLPEDYAQINA